MSKKRKRTLIFLAALLILILASYFFSGAENRELDYQTRADLPGEFVQLSSGFTHYEFSGNPGDPLVVLVHGFSVPYYVYDPTVPDLLEAGFAVLRYDLYGRGFSDRSDVEYDLGLYLEQLSDLLDHLGTKQPIHIVGLSQGAPVAGAFANRFSGQVSSLTLIDPLITQVTNKDILPMGLSLIGEYITRVVLVPHILPGSQVDDFHHPENFADWETRYREQLQYRGFTRAILSSIRHLPEMEPLKEYLAADAAGLPIQIIWGRHDQTIPFADIEKFLADIPSAALHIIEESGHIPHFEHPEAVNPILIDFFQSF